MKGKIWSLGIAATLLVSSCYRQNYVQDSAFWGGRSNFTPAAVDSLNAFFKGDWRKTAFYLNGVADGHTIRPYRQMSTSYQLESIYQGGRAGLSPAAIDSIEVKYGSWQLAYNYLLGKAKTRAESRR